MVTERFKSGVVVPTMGERPEFLIECLRSIQKSGSCFVILVAPSTLEYKHFNDSGLINLFVPDPKLGLAAAINEGMNHLPEEIKYATWLGDDDLLNPCSIEFCEKVMDASPEIVMTFGDCRYVDEQGTTIWNNSFGEFAARIIRFGPCLIPQPGSLFRFNEFKKIGGLDTSYGWAFDFDLFIKLSKIGKLRHVGIELAAFRWHADSLTVKQRKRSVREAHRARTNNQTKVARVIMFPFEPIIQIATYLGPRLFRK